MRLPFLSEEGVLYDRIRLFYLFPVPHPILYPSSAAQIELLQLLVQIASENNLGEGVIVKIDHSSFIHNGPKLIITQMSSASK